MADGRDDHRDSMSRMPSHVAFLRAVNLGGHRSAPRAELRGALEAAGFSQVDTFRASGNVVLTARGGERRIGQAIEETLAGRLGFSVVVYLRSARELRRLIDHAAGMRPAPAPGGKLQVAFLRASPSAPEREEVLRRSTDDDLLAFSDREMLWLRRQPAGRSALNLRALEKLIGPWTMRTMDTVTQIVVRYFD